MTNRVQQGQSPANSIIKGQKKRPSLALHRFSVQSFQLSTRGFPYTVSPSKVSNFLHAASPPYVLYMLYVDFLVMEISQ